MAELLTWLEQSSLGYIVRTSGVWTYGLLNLTHILGVSSLFGAILVLDLRLVGFWPAIDVAALARPVVPVATTGFVLAAGSGICMLATNGSEYIGNPFLLIKFPAIAAGLVNVAVLNLLPAWKTRDRGEISPRGQRQLAIAGGISLCCWVTAVSAGRLIGYW